MGDVVLEENPQKEKERRKKKRGGGGGDRLPAYSWAICALHDGY